MQADWQKEVNSVLISSPSIYDAVGQLTLGLPLLLLNLGIWRKDLFEFSPLLPLLPLLLI
ncbi:hypothetical protein [Nostoc sp.]|uniref:hypothetical protein n=1 Tax=Nostoc sp. TaxID=1180 RepID=UPI002FF9F447